MGKTAFDGPVYGAKQTLYSFRLADISSGGGNGISSVVIAGCIIPAGEDWYATELGAFRGSTGSTSVLFTLNDDSTQVSTVTFAGSSVGASAQTVIPRDSGEYEGTRMVAGSTITFTVTQSSAVGASSGYSISLYGYRRWVSSTRDV